jgi:hypothetical protein
MYLRATCSVWLLAFCFWLWAFGFWLLLVFACSVQREACGFLLSAFCFLLFALGRIKGDWGSLGTFMYCSVLITY